VDLSVYTPVCLPSSVRNRDNTPALAIGWGRTSPLILPSEPVCNKTGKWTYHQRQGAKNILQQVRLTVKPSDAKGFLKTVSGVRNNGPCTGDSGGPLLARDRGQHTVIGVVSQSFGYKYNVTVTPDGNQECLLVCAPGKRDYYTQIGLYTEWIKKKMASPDFCIGGAYANGTTGGAGGGGAAEGGGAD